MSRSGSAYSNPDTISYAYNDRSELTGAVANVDSTYSYSYAYDPIGNRITANEAGVPWTYTTNSLNQYISATENNVQMDFAYDLDGSMTYRPVDATGGWTQVWNGENRMVETFNGTDRLTFKYDYMGRRFEKKVYENDVLTKRSLYAYDGFKQIAEFDALDNNALLNTYLWQPVGLDVPLLRNGSEFYVSDANKNVVALMDTTGAVTDTCVYDPFGNCAHAWNDIIDPNGSYFLDNILSVGAKIFSLGRAKDYTIKIPFSSEFTAQKRTVWSFSGGFPAFLKESHF